MSVRDCLAKVKVGDDIYIKRTIPGRFDLRSMFRTTVVGFNNYGTPIIGSNVIGGLNGSRVEVSCNLHNIAEAFTSFASCSQDRFIILKIVKKNLEHTR